MVTVGTKRDIWINRVRNDISAVVRAFSKYMQEIDPSWGVLRYDIGGSLGEHIAGNTKMFKTQYGGISGSETRGEEILSPHHLSDVDMVIWVSPMTDIWKGANLWMSFEHSMFRNSKKYGLKSRNFTMINMGGNEVVSEYSNTVLRVPLDEHDLRKTHELVIHIRKPGQKGQFGREWRKKKG